MTTKQSESSGDNLTPQNVRNSLEFMCGSYQRFSVQVFYTENARNSLECIMFG